MERITTIELDLLLNNFFELNIFEDVKNLKIVVEKNRLLITLNLFYFKNIFNKLEDFFLSHDSYDMTLSITNTILFEVSIVIENIDNKYDNVDYKFMTGLLQKMVIDDRMSEYYLEYKNFIDYYNNLLNDMV